MEIIKTIKILVTEKEEDTIRDFVGLLEDLDDAEYDAFTEITGNPDLYSEVNQIFSAIERKPW